MPISIAIVGAHSTGKTTLVHKLREHLKEQGYAITTIAELSRQCPYPINEASTLEAQAWIQHEQIAREVAWDRSTVLLSDRSALDNFAYMTLACEGHDVSPYLKKAIDHTRAYTFIFKTQLLPLSAEDDGVRTTDAGFRQRIDATISALFVDHGVPFIALPHTYLYETHIAFMWAHIQKALYSQ